LFCNASLATTQEFLAAMTNRVLVTGFCPPRSRRESVVGARGARRSTPRRCDRSSASIAPMNAAELTRLISESLYLVLLLSAPVLLAAVVIGGVIGVLSAATQVQEQSLAFVPKLVGVSLVLALFGGWMAAELVGFTDHSGARSPRSCRDRGDHERALRRGARARAADLLRVIARTMPLAFAARGSAGAVRLRSRASPSGS
jgi:flagellar biosynthetic protein FliQ